MTFREPIMLAALVLIPLAAMVYVSMQRRRRREAAAFANPALLPNLVTGRPGFRWGGGSRWCVSARRPTSGWRCAATARG